MPGQAGTLELLARHVGLALQPLQVRLTADQVLPYLAEMGLQFPRQLLQPAFLTAINAVANAAGALPATLTQLDAAIAADNAVAIASDGVKLIQQIGNVLSAIPAIGAQLTGLSASLPGMNAADVNTFAAGLPSSILSHSIITYLEGFAPGFLGMANIFGIVDYLENPGVDGDPTHPPFISRKLQFGNLGTLLKTPASLFQSLFGWGSPTFDGTVFMPRLSTTLDLMQFYSQLSPDPPLGLTTGLFNVDLNPAGTIPGLTVELLRDLPAGFDLTMPVSDLWSVRAQVKGNFNAGLSATLTPPTGISLKPPSGTLNGLLEMDLLASGAGGKPIVIIGQTGGSRIEATAFTFGAGLAATWNAASGSATVAPSVRIQVTGGKAVIDTSNADGFLATVLSGVHVEAGFDFSCTWVPDSGIHFAGGSQLELDLPLHFNLGPVTISTLYLVAGASPGGIPLELSAALGLSLGPFEISVDRIGTTALLSFPSAGGNLGPADLRMAFKPPNGLGISLDLGLAAGGGYLAFDSAKGQYAGVLQVSLVDIIQVVVIAVVDTILPDGSKGFSFLLIITFNFPPIQLGFGFTLIGVGGVGGVNRTMSIDSLQAGFRAHTLDMVLAPPDPIANAPQIICDIRNFFPVAEGRYLFGPLLTLGWGVPTLVSLKLGVLLEVPDPVRIVIVGLIDAGLPTEDVALMKLHIEVLGVIDFGAQTLAINGSLYDSSLLIYALAGDLVFRLSWGSNPNFVYSLGGFNPHFNTDGLNVPANLKRMSVSIGDGDNPRLSSNSYFAITSNSVQFGANVQAYAEAGGFSIQGYLGFDILIILSPFSFEFDFHVSLDVAFDGHTLAGLTVDGTIAGPTPWHLHGDASISILFLTVSASLDLSWGSGTQATIPQRPVLPDLIEAFNNPASWSTALPSGAGPIVSLTTPAPGNETLLVHPMGTLSVKETVVPLDLTISRYGNATPSDGTQFSISNVQIDNRDETKQTITDYFAPGQFLTLSDADKLASPGFQQHDAGIEIGSTTLLTGQDVARTVTYDESYIDDPANLSRFSRLYQMPYFVHLALSSQGAGFASLAKNTGLGKYQAGGAGSPISVADVAYVVTNVTDLGIRSDIVSGSGSSFFQARGALTAYLAAHPEQSANLQVLPLHEVPA